MSYIMVICSIKTSSIQLTLAFATTALWKIVQKLGRVGRNDSESAIFIFVSEKALKGNGNIFSHMCGKHIFFLLPNMFNTNSFFYVFSFAEGTEKAE